MTALGHHQGGNDLFPRFQRDIEDVLAEVPQLPCLCAENVEYCDACRMWQSEQEHVAFGIVQMHSPYCEFCKGEDGKGGGLA